MGAIYGRRIRAGEITIDNVPKLWKAATLKWLKEHPETEEG